MAGIYIHIPFCRQACTYCDFFFETSLKHRDGFVKKLQEEILSYKNSIYTSEEIKTIYLGGGTPSRLQGDELLTIFEILNQTFRISGDAEVTMEVNPDDITPEYLKKLKAAGVNRLSVGVQTFNPDRLRFMNRAHSRDEALRVLGQIAESGFKSWTADLIYGNPGQSTEDLLADINLLLSFQPPHISAYTLTVEPNTRLGSQVRKGIISPKPDDEVSDQMEVLADRLESAGILRYEVSNFAHPGHESRHNSSYWSHVNYLGLGPSAHSFWWDENSGKPAVRRRNKPQLRHYMDHPPEAQITDEEFLNPETLAEERLLTGLRTIEGVSVAELKNRYHYHLSDPQKAYLQNLTAQGMITGLPGKIILTSKGIPVADYLTLNIITRKEQK